jgi:hypothetical protein
MVLKISLNLDIKIEGLGPGYYNTHIDFKF